eukprot:COSAG02_NODE_56185_length_286_cov_1.647059_1_plen_49_part_10
MLGAVSQLLDVPVDDLRLTQSMVGGKCVRALPAAARKLRCDSAETDYRM